MDLTQPPLNPLEKPDFRMDTSYLNPIDNETKHFIFQWDIYDDVDFGYVGFGPNLSAENDISLLTPKIVVANSGEFSMSFEHYYDFEFGDPSTPTDQTAWDGGVIEISIEGAEWVDVESVGGEFLVGYNGVINELNPYLSNRSAFVSLISASGIADEQLIFPEGTLNGKEVQLRFRIGTDSAVAGWGWNIDNVSFANITNNTPFSSLIENSGVCVNRAPLLIDVAGPASAIESGNVTLSAQGFDNDADELTYVWSQIGGSGTVDVSSTAATLIFVAPAVTEDTQLVFSVATNDGNETSEPVLINVDIVANQAPTITAVTSTISLKEKATTTLSVSASDPEGDSLVYQWELDGVILANTGSTYEYAAPSVSQDTTVVFKVTASDGDETSEVTQIIVTIENSSGGSIGLYGLLFMSLVFIRRRQR
jgi:hypothetical protein